MIHEIGIIFVCVGIFGLIFRLLKQPMVPAFILSGIAVGPLVLGKINGAGAINALSEMAFVVMLFVIGIEMDLERLKKIGIVAILGGIVQVAVTFAVGWAFAFLIGLNHMTCVYFGLILAFSSTMLVVKILGDNHDLDTLYGRVSVGILIMQDILAIFALAILSAKTFSMDQTLSIVTLTAGIILIVVFVGGKYVFPIIFDYVARDRETLFCVSLAVMFIIGFYAQSRELTLGIGAFLTGLALSSLAYRYEVIGDLKALKSFFAVLFFASLGLQMVPPSVVSPGGSAFITLAIFFHLVAFQVWTILGLIFLAMIVKPIIVTGIIVFFGYERSTACHAGLSLGQLSEFGMVLAIFGVMQEGISENFLMAVIIATTVTIILSAYTLKYLHLLAGMMVRHTAWLDRIAWLKQAPYNFEPTSGNNFQVAIVGHDKLGKLIANALRKNGISYVVVDSNPEVIHSLARQNIPYVFGDVTCPEVLAQLDLQKIKTVFSSLPEQRDNSLLIGHLQRTNPDVNFVAIVNSCCKARRFYELGAHYVLITYVLAAEQLEASQTSFDLKSLLGAEQAELKLYGEAHHKELCSECAL
jgi:Kef-type K+ transport system membrane component KefB